MAQRPGCGAPGAADTVLPALPAVEVVQWWIHKDAAHYFGTVHNFQSVADHPLLDEATREIAPTFGPRSTVPKTCVGGGEVCVRPVPFASGRSQADSARVAAGIRSSGTLMEDELSRCCRSPASPMRLEHRAR